MPICPPSSESSGSGSHAWIYHGLVLGVAAAAATVVYLYQLPSSFRSRAVGIIPVRYASSHFEGKLLTHILGKPMIQVFTYTLHAYLVLLLSVLVLTSNLRE